MKVKKVPKEVAGVPDGMEAMTSCCVTNFDLDKNGRPAKMNQPPKGYPCRLLASRTSGTVSISAHGCGVMVTVRMDDIKKLVEEAYAEGA